MADVHKLPVPVAESWEWQLRAACRSLDSRMFFHPDRERGAARVERERRAKSICRVCPVIEQCLRYALAVDEPYGVWGGTSAVERRALLGVRHLPVP